MTAQVMNVFYFWHCRPTSLSSTPSCGTTRTWWGRFRTAGRSTLRTAPTSSPVGARSRITIPTPGCCTTTAAPSRIDRSGRGRALPRTLWQVGRFVSGSGLLPHPRCTPSRSRVARGFIYISRVPSRVRHRAHIDSLSRALLFSLARARAHARTHTYTHTHIHTHTHEKI